MRGRRRPSASAIVGRTVFFDSATGCVARCVPEGPERDELIQIVRLGVAFKQQHRGRRHGFLTLYIAGVVSGMTAPVTFERLIATLEIAAARRNEGTANNPIEHCSRTWELLKICDPRRGSMQVTFGRLRNIFTDAKKINSRHGLTRESHLIASKNTAI